MKYLFLNHKMNLEKSEIEKYVGSFPNAKFSDLEVVVIPSAIYLPYFDNEKFTLGIQNVSFAKGGSLTGDIGAKQAKSLGVKYCLVGHSERRKFYKEDNQQLIDKINNLYEEDIVPVLCIGEDDIKNREKVFREELEIFKSINVKNIIIAYEPIYSIGTGKVLENLEIKNSITLIRNILEEYNISNVPVLYGGSVDDNNIDKLVQIDNLDGFLVGKASLSVEKVLNMMEVINDFVD